MLDIPRYRGYSEKEIKMAKECFSESVDKGYGKKTRRRRSGTFLSKARRRKDKEKVKEQLSSLDITKNKKD